MARRLARIRGDAARDDDFDPTRARAPRGRRRAASSSQTGQTAPAGGRLGRLRRAPRAAVLRAMKPHTAYAQQVDRGVTDALMHLGHAVESLEGQGRRARRPASATAPRSCCASCARSTAASARSRRRGSTLAAGRRAARHGRRRTSACSGGVGLSDPGRRRRRRPTGFEGEPWSEAYNDAHRRYVAHELDDARAARALPRAAPPLPDGLGRGLDERVVEFPWLAAQRLGGRVLDAGSTLNHLHVLTRLRPRVDELHIATLAPEERSFPDLGVSYLYADLRELPLADATYDRVLSLSTLEHVGTDTSYYGGETEVAEDPQRELLAAVAELRRVLRPGGDCYITVPVGRGERFEWVRSLTPAELDEIVEAFEPGDQSRSSYFRYADGALAALGPRRASRTRATATTSRATGVGPDGVVAAEAVACLHLVKPG